MLTRLHGVQNGMKQRELVEWYLRHQQESDKLGAGGEAELQVAARTTCPPHRRQLHSTAVVVVVLVDVL